MKWCFCWLPQPRSRSEFDYVGAVEFWGAIALAMGGVIFEILAQWGVLVWLLLSAAPLYSEEIVWTLWSSEGVKGILKYLR